MTVADWIQRSVEPADARRRRDELLSERIAEGLLARVQRQLRSAQDDYDSTGIYPMSDEVEMELRLAERCYRVVARGLARVHCDVSDLSPSHSARLVFTGGVWLHGERELDLRRAAQMLAHRGACWAALVQGMGEHAGIAASRWLLAWGAAP